jgi:hypothetical protein
MSGRMSNSQVFIWFTSYFPLMDIEFIVLSAGTSETFSCAERGLTGMRTTWEYLSKDSGVMYRTSWQLTPSTGSMHSFRLLVRAELKSTSVKSLVPVRYWSLHRAYFGRVFDDDARHARRKEELNGRGFAEHNMLEILLGGHLNLKLIPLALKLLHNVPDLIL